MFLNLSGSDSQKLSHHFTLKAGAKLTFINIALHGNMEHEIISLCEGADATSSLTTIAYARGKEKQKVMMRNIFQAARGGGEMLMKGVAEEQAHSVLHGLIDIGLKGNETNTYLTQDVLMLDPSAKVDAIPGLEIKTNDVKASHSAGVRRITEEDYFTFAARGIEREEARHMFILGFLMDAVKGLPVEEEVLLALEKKMNDKR
jgi:Fe-S cluster assembly scaffold protein SufB